MDSGLPGIFLTDVKKGRPGPDTRKKTVKIFPGNKKNLLVETSGSLCVFVTLVLDGSVFFPECDIAGAIKVELGLIRFSHLLETDA